MQSIPSLPSLLGPLWLRVVAADRVLWNCMKIDLALNNLQCLVCCKTKPNCFLLPNPLAKFILFIGLPFCVCVCVYIYIYIYIYIFSLCSVPEILMDTVLFGAMPMKSKRNSFVVACSFFLSLDVFAMKDYMTLPRTLFSSAQSAGAQNTPNTSLQRGKTLPMSVLHMRLNNLIVKLP